MEVAKQSGVDEKMHHPENILQNIPVILNKILSPLPVKTLNTCARVCKTWRSMVDSIKSSRKDQTTWLCIESEDKDDDNIARELKVFTENLSTEPENALLFCTPDVFDKPMRVPSRHQTRLPRNAKCEVMETGEYVKSLLPKACKVFAVGASGIVGTCKDLKTMKEVEESCALSGLFLSHIEGLRVRQFTLDPYSQRVDESGTVAEATFDASEISNIPAGEKVKAILMFCDEPYNVPDISYGLKSHFAEAVIAGGFVDFINYFDDSEMREPTDAAPSILCIALCGEQVHVRSIVIKEEIVSRSELEAKVKTLKDCHLPEEKSFAFMFACVGRGKSHYGEENVESQVFRKIFPRTPLLGFFGNGEIGFNATHEYVPNTADSKSENTPTKYHPKLHHAYTTILVLVSVT